MIFSLVDIIEMDGLDVKTLVILLGIFTLLISSDAFFSPVVADILSHELK